MDVTPRALGESTPYPAGRGGGFLCPRDGTHLRQMSSHQDGPHMGTSTYACDAEGHVWTHAEGVDGIRAWAPVQATASRLL